MNLDEHTIKLEARLQAIEHLLTTMWAYQFSRMDDPEHHAERARENLLRYADTFVVEGLDDPVLTDMVSAEMRLAYERLTDEVARQLRDIRQEGRATR